MRPAAHRQSPDPHERVLTGACGRKLLFKGGQPSSKETPRLPFNRRAALDRVGHEQAPNGRGARARSARARSHIWLVLLVLACGARARAAFHRLKVFKSPRAPPSRTLSRWVSVFTALKCQRIPQRDIQPGNGTEPDPDSRTLSRTDADSYLQDTVISTLVAGMDALSGSMSPTDAMFGKLAVIASEGVSRLPESSLLTGDEGAPPRREAERRRSEELRDVMSPPPPASRAPGHPPASVPPLVTLVMISYKSAITPINLFSRPHPHCSRHFGPVSGPGGLLPRPHSPFIRAGVHLQPPMVSLRDFGFSATEKTLKDRFKTKNTHKIVMGRQLSNSSHCVI